MIVDDGRFFNSTLVPGMVAGDAAGGLQAIDVGGQAGFSAGRLSIHGSDGSDQQIEIDGLAVNSPRDGLLSTFVADGNYTEYALNYSANTAEFQTGGVRVNVIPRDGGTRSRVDCLPMWLLKASKLATSMRS